MKTVQKLLSKFNKNNRFVFSQKEYDLVLDFFLSYQSFRTLYDCSLQTKIDIEKCKKYKRMLYKDRKLGMYYFKENAEPQSFMFKYIEKLVPDFSCDLHIAEIGP